VHADGTIELFVNGKTIATFAVPEYPYATGRIGVDGLAGDLGLRWDDFGGGNWK
jgi:hypothetical protein